MSDNTLNAVGFALLAGAVCFCAVQLRGCNTDANEQIASLAKQGIRAEMTPNGNIRVIDTRDFKSTAEKEIK